MRRLLTWIVSFFRRKRKMAWHKCMACNVEFKADPDNVPCGYDEVGNLRSLCSACVNISNTNREKMGLPEIKIIQGVYDATDKRSDV